LKVKILVTGASGFLGSWACRVLSKSHEVIGLVRENSDTYRLNNIQGLKIQKSQVYLWKNLIKEINPDVILILHWDGVSNLERNSEGQELNVENFREIISAAVAANIPKIIGFGSQAELGPVATQINDNQGDNPTTLYGKAKVECRLEGFELTKNSMSDFIWVRIFSTYGPLDAENWLVPSAILTLNESKKFKTTSGEQAWSFLHAYDFVLAVKTLIENKSHQKVFNLGNTTTNILKEVLITIQNLIGKGDLIEFGSIPYRSDQVMRLEPRCEGLVDLGWKPIVPLNNGLIQTINWFTNQPESALQTEANSSFYFDLPQRIKRIDN
jgi:nucleoside-diphosphate-sugar epimerase